MTKKVITVRVNAEVEEKFRQTARSVLGRKKGYLGKALTDAMENWITEKRKMDTVAAILNLLDEGISLGGIKYIHREELHER